jgi:YVTN family beta-propeller protein
MTLNNTRFRTSFPLFLAALLAAGSLQAATLVVANKAEATASLVDLPSGKVLATLPTGVAPHEVGISPDGKLALVTNYGAQQPGSSLTLIDVPGAKVVKTIDLGEYRRPHGVTWLDGRRALVTAEQNKALLEIDVEAGKVARAFPTGQEVSHMVVASPDGARAYVANIGSGSLTAIDLKAGKHLADVPTGKGAEGIDVTPDGKQVWVTNRAADTVSVVDAATLKVVGTVDSAKFPIRAKTLPGGKRVLVSNARSGDVSVISVAERKVEKRIPMPAEAGAPEGRLMGDFQGPVPIGIVVEPGGKRAYVALANADRIMVLDLDEGKVAGSLTAGKEPDGMAWSPVEVKAGPSGR